MTPTVTMAIPTRNESAHLEATLESVAVQSYPNIVEVLVADGRSTDETREIAQRFAKVRVIDNPRIRQAAGLNAIIGQATGDVIVRVDGHCQLAPDYVARCIQALERTGAAVVGGPMVPVADNVVASAVAASMTSLVGAGPARFHVGGRAGWVDTVYLGAYRRELALVVGGYAEDVGVNEDAEFAHRMSRHGGVWFDPSITSTYEPRSTIPSVLKQFYWYGRSRAVTAKRHPSSISIRQLAAPALVLGLLSPARRRVLPLYLAVLAGGAWQARDRGAAVAARVPAVMSSMHLAWGVGFLIGTVVPPPRGRGGEPDIPPVSPA